jgi:hypothetical protein
MTRANCFANRRISRTEEKRDENKKRRENGHGGNNITDRVTDRLVINEDRRTREEDRNERIEQELLTRERHIHCRLIRQHWWCHYQRLERITTITFSPP